MDKFKLELAENVKNLTLLDIDRIVYVGKADAGRTLGSLSTEMSLSTDDGRDTLDALNYSLGKLYKSQAAPGIQNLDDLRKWIRGLIKNPFVTPPKVVKEFSSLPETDHVVFVYGSLLDPASLARTIGQSPSSIEYLQAHLLNHVVEWGAPSRRLNYSDVEWKSLDYVQWLWLAIRRTGNEDDVVPGALIKLRDRQLREVQLRESHYHKSTVTDDIRVGGRPVKGPRGDTLYGEIITFAPDLSMVSDHQTELPTAVRAGYYDDVDSYLSRIHPGEATRLPELPKGVMRLEGFPTDDRVVDEFWASISKHQLAGYWLECDDELYTSKRAKRWTGQGFVTIPFIVKPFVLNRRTYNKVVEAAECAVSLMVKAHRLVLETPELFDLNRYTGADRKLSDPKLANHYTDRPVVARVDLALRGDQLKIFEVNTDSPAGMSHLDHLVDLQWRQIESKKHTGNLVEVLAPPRKNEVCESLADAFFRHWEYYRERVAEAGQDRELRRIAIVDKDVTNAAAYYEFQHFQKLLNRNGIDVSILDSTDLRYRPEHKELVDRAGRPIDAVYKRLLWKDALDSGMGGLDDPLCQAYLDNAVFVMNSFLSRLAGSKLNLAIAKSRFFKARCSEIGMDLTADEENVLVRHIPETFLWGPAALDDRPVQELYARVTEDVTEWVLKVFHGKGGQEFIDGATSRDIPPIGTFLNTWADKRFVAQQHQAHGVMNIPIVDPLQLDVTWNRYPFILGAYVIDGKCVAVEAKADKNIPINVNQGGRRTAVFSLKA